MHRAKRAKKPPTAAGGGQPTAADAAFAKEGKRWFDRCRLRVAYGTGAPISFSSSSSWMMIRGVTIIIRLCVVRPMPTFLNRRLTHGTTMHGQQWLEPGRCKQPTAYYGRSSGAGIALADAAAGESVGIAGLGVGTLACYRKPGQRWTFFEIDPEVARYSRNRTFTFLADCAPDARIVIGDARLELAEEPAGALDVLVIDAFTSDAIPMHLLTQEAFETYGRALSDDGLLLVRVSNRFIDLAPMVAALAQTQGWHGRMRRDIGNPPEGQSASDWIALTRGEGRIDRLERSSPYPWDDLPPPSPRAWTDDNASVVPLLRF